MFKHKILLFLLVNLVGIQLIAQVKIGDNPNTIHPASLIELESTKKGLLLPRMRENQRDGINNPPEGLTIYNLDEGCTNYYSGASWKSYCGGALDTVLINPGDTSLLNSNYWSVLGNWGIDENQHFIGTRNSQSLVIKTANKERARYDIRYNLMGGYNATNTLDVGFYNVMWGRGLKIDGNYSAVFGYLNDVDGHYNFAAGRGNILGSPSYQVALGYNNKVDASAAIALGYEHKVEGGYSLAAGRGNTINDNYQIALGYNNTLIGSNAFAIGHTNEVSSGYSGAFGFKNKIGLSSSNSFAMGHSNVINGGAYSFASGIRDTIIGDYAFVAGLDNLVSGNASGVIGGLNTVSNAYSFVTGRFNNVSGSYSFVSGHSNLVTESYGAALGNANEVNGSYAMAFGLRNKANASYNLAMGADNTTTANYSIAIGHQNISSGNTGIAIGSYSESDGTRSMTLGSRVANGGFQGCVIIGDNTGGGTVPVTFNTVANEMMMRFNGGYKLYSKSNLSAGVELATGGGAWASISDRNKKENFQDLNKQEVLEKVANLEISNWNYIAQEDDIRHIGPMAQDFYEAFDLGTSNKTITTSDISGVNMAAIQALYERIEKLEKENKILTAELQTTKDLEEKLADIEAALEASGIGLKASKN